MSIYTKSEYINELREMLFNASNVLIVSHSNPDGDAVGSVCAMYGYLKNRGVKCSVALPDTYPDYLSFLDPHREIYLYSEEPLVVENLFSAADLIIGLDFNQLSRVGGMAAVFERSTARKVLIDHHPNPNNESFNLVFSDTEVSSTSELLYWILNALEGGYSSLSGGTANALYTGMMTDTNNFANSVNSNTFTMASHLLSLGVDKEWLQHSVFGGFSEKRMRLMGHILLNKMVILEEFSAGYITLSLEEQREFEFSEGDSEGFVNLPLNIKGVNISALFTERPDQIRVSLRSVNNFSVNRLSQSCFNGGGHERAAGGKLFIPLSQVPEYFEKCIRNGYLSYFNPENNKENNL